MPKRKPNRLKSYDYSQNGAYFVTICVKDRRELLWNVGATFGRPQSRAHLSGYGLLIDDEIHKIESIYTPAVSIDKYVVMPNHVHLIILLKAERCTGGVSIWQKLFHDHIIRNEPEYQKIWKYIDENPLKWKDDCFYVMHEQSSKI